MLPAYKPRSTIHQLQPAEALAHITIPRLAHPAESRDEPPPDTLKRPTHELHATGIRFQDQLLTEPLRKAFDYMQRWAVSPLSTRVETSAGTELLAKIEARELTRAFCGALFVSLPLLYTMEMWERALILPRWALFAWVAFGFAATLGYIHFAGYRTDSNRGHMWLDAISAMGIGIAASVITLLLIGRYSISDSPEVIVRMVLLEMVPTAIGASVAANQLGGGDSSRQRSGQGALSPDATIVLGSLLGALLFAFNIAPTYETQVITYSINYWYVAGIAAFSILVSYLVVFVADFSGGNRGEGRIIKGRWVETSISYLISLAVGYVLLLLFGYITPSIPFALQLSWVVIIGYGTTLAGAAGRLVL